MSSIESLHEFVIDTQGWTVLKSLGTEKFMTSLREEVESAVLNDPTHSGNGLYFRQNILNAVPSLEPLLGNQRVYELATGILGKNCRISYITGIVLEAGSDRGMWHADWPFSRLSAGHFDFPYPDARAQLTVIWMLQDFTQLNGTLVLPGTHRLGWNPTAWADQEPRSMYRKFPNEVIVEGNVGSALILDSRLWHAPAANRSDCSRVAAAVRYSPWWLDLRILQEESRIRRRMVEATGASENLVPYLSQDVFQRFSALVQSLTEDLLEGGC